MDFHFTEAQEKLRSDIRAFLAENLPEDFEESPVGTEWSGDRDEYETAREFNKSLAKRGWLTAHWPKEYGGLPRRSWSRWSCAKRSRTAARRS